MRTRSVVVEMVSTLMLHFCPCFISCTYFFIHFMLCTFQKRMHLHMVYNYHIQSFLLDFGLMREIDVSLLETEAEVFTPQLVSTKPTRGYGPLSVQ
ncbi:hypothetical protein F4703DRAFT_1469124 [Phycomyces blakesleeanus]